MGKTSHFHNICPQQISEDPEQNETAYKDETTNPECSTKETFLPPAWLHLKNQQ